jgi:PadR family transcriptional regulator PadR
MALAPELLPGTLELLILKAVSLAPKHGYRILLRIQELSRGALTITQGALYPALYRLEEQDLLASAWGTSENNRRAKFYRLTKAGERRLRQETQDWARLANGVGLVLDARPERA